MGNDDRKNLYEGMFLVDSAQAAEDWDGLNEAITRILERADAKIESIKKWDERQLAYPIEGRDRGTYILTYFRVDGPRVTDIETDINLSERIMRALILKTDKMSKEDLEKDTPIEAQQRREKEAMERAQAARSQESESEGSEEENNDQ